MKSYAAIRLTTLWACSALFHVQPAQHPRMTMALLVLDVVFGISILDALFEIDDLADTALDLAEAGALSFRTTNGCGVQTVQQPGPGAITC